MAYSNPYRSNPEILFDFEVPHIEERLDLPDLSGSEKQIAWARKIRASLLADILHEISQARRATEAQRSSRRAQVMEGALFRTEASWWIDNRDQGPAVVRVLLGQG